MIPLLSGLPAFLLSLLVGLILGSFASALSYRIPRHESWVRARSRCTSCGHALGLPDLVPVLSWAFLRGRCRHCHAGIGVRYPLIELSTMALCVAVFAVMGLTPQAVCVMLAMPFLVALIVIDLDHMILPDHLNAILFALGLGYLALADLAALPMALMGALVGAAVYAGVVFVTGWVMTRALKRDAVGFGDVKFLAVAGVWLGLPLLPVFLVLSGACGVAFGLIWKTMGRGAVFPFGPALIAALILCLLAGPQMASALVAAMGHF